jgi:hypothetical protein
MTSRKTVGRLEGETPVEATSQYDAMLTTKQNLYKKYFIGGIQNERIVKSI